ncbi:hypothetical protein ACFX2H_038791 [Malus domestica]
MYATMLGFMCAWIRKLGLLLLCSVFSAGFNPPCLLAVLGFLCHGRVLEEAMTLNGRATWMNSAFLSIKRCTSLVVLAAQLFCWTGQFIGHGVFEKRAPALLDNLVQAFLIGPFFVLLECLQLVFGYEPYRGFHASVEEKIEAQIKEWQNKKQKKIT